MRDEGEREGKVEFRMAHKCGSSLPQSTAKNGFIAKLPGYT